MDAAYIRDLVIIILFSLLIIIIIAGSIGAFIAYRKVNKTVQSTRESVQSTIETVERPVRSVQRTIAYIRGGFKGFRESFSILFGRGVNHGHQSNQQQR